MQYEGFVVGAVRCDCLVFVAMLSLGIKAHETIWAYVLELESATFIRGITDLVPLSMGFLSWH